MVLSGPGMDPTYLCALSWSTLCLDVHKTYSKCDFSVLSFCSTVCYCSTGTDPTMYVKCVSKSRQLHTCALPPRFAFYSNGLLGGSQCKGGPETTAPSSFFSMVFLSRGAKC